MATKKEQKNSETKKQKKVEAKKEVVVKDYYEAESWQFSGCGD